MSTNVEKFFYFCCFMTHGSSYISPYAYGIMHRLHHAHTDTEDDPHSPAHHPGFFATMWQTRNSYHNIYIGKTIVDEKLKKDLPQWTAFEKIAHNWKTRVAWVVIYILFYVFFATAWWMYLFLPITVVMATFQGTVINWWAHKFGYINFPMQNTSKNMFPVDIIFCGDAYHNNHHRFPGRVKNSHRWFEIDLIYYITYLLQRTKLIQWKN